MNERAVVCQSMVFCSDCSIDGSSHGPFHTARAFVFLLKNLPCYELKLLNIGPNVSRGV